RVMSAIGAATGAAFLLPTFLWPRKEKSVAVGQPHKLNLLHQLVRPKGARLITLTLALSLKGRGN
ncbi:MAG: hypothetical protein ACJ8J7_16805, partial [Sulfurifustaceae bacterium]